MTHDPKHTSSVEDTEDSATPQDVPSERPSPEPLIPTMLAISKMSASTLAAYCIREISRYRNGEPNDGRYGLELFHRAILHGDQEAWTCLQECFSGLVLGWLRRHPRREAACRLDHEENYVAQTFERFWLATAHNQKLVFNSQAAALRYLQTSLNGAIIDALRAYSRSKEVALPQPGTMGEPLVEDSIDSGELWKLLHELFPEWRERRLIYLFFYCGLKPREIVRQCPREFPDVREVYRLRRNIYERLLRDANRLRWRLD